MTASTNIAGGLFLSYPLMSHSPNPPPGSSKYNQTWNKYQIFGLTIATDYPFQLGLQDGSGSQDLIFRCVDQAPMGNIWDEAQLVHTSPRKTEEGLPVASFYRMKDYSIIHVANVADYYLWPDRILCHILNQQHDYMIEIDFLGTVMATWLEQRRIPVLHASAVIIDNQAIAFLSWPTGGKSSLAATLMQAGYPLLTDDILAVDRVDDHFWGRPGYPTMRMWPQDVTHFLESKTHLETVTPNSSKRRVPVGVGGFGEFCSESHLIKAIYLPERYDPSSGKTKIQVEPFPPTQALIELIRHSFLHSIRQALGWQARRMEFLADLSEQVRVRRLLYPSGHQYLSQVRNVILEDLDSLHVDRS